MNYDFIIIGHGLAGAILGYTLRKRGYDVLTIDEPKINSASRVAAGLVNPIAGKRFAKSWMADEFIPAADAFYDELEERFGRELFIHKPIYKIFSSIEEQNTWMAKSADEGWNGYIEATYTKSIGHDTIDDPFGGIMVNKGGYLKVADMLDILTDDLLQKKLLLPKRFNMANLILNENGVEYDGIKAKHIIFCEGYQVIQNPYFKWLPMQPTKGEVIELEADNFNLECIYNKAVYVVPIEANRFKVGATYDWRQPDEKPTDAGRAELTARVAQITSKECQVINHKAGIRPAVRDRRPLAGQHPDYSQVSVFNGMGSKGVLMAPYLANKVADALEGKSDMMTEIHISRYYSLYYNYKNHQNYQP